ncbi:xanthine dehydrogenase accessory protein XdhC [Ostreiculturibacter nitratireducens]|uniref:xanthine dehydrogenase accessory protein XdhC n=1 Tax=Ostreiculturibacter nitratireducens TaxID=3075226 RepID=UPI0031B58C8A
MSFDREALARAVAAHGSVVRIVVAGASGSTPRETGASMLVWESGQDGTIGGGTLEWEATDRARRMLAEGAAPRVVKVPLGPALGQCCGGAVTIVLERFDRTALAALPDAPVIARPVGDPAEMPLSVRRLVQRAREGLAPSPQLVEGWMVEPASAPSRTLWIWGAGHVGRALVSVLARLPDFAITWVDTSADRFPPVIPERVEQIVAAEPGRLVAHAPRDAEHLVLTFSHALDLDLCHRLLTHGFARLGLIGSATKWARFRSRLATLGHGAADIGRIDCPIGDPSLGKHPQAIAVGVAAALLKAQGAARTKKERAG